MGVDPANLVLGRLPVVHEHGTPSNWVVRWAHALMAGCPVLDVACGAGRHSRWLAARGHRVTAIDVDPAVAGGDGIEVVRFDLEAGAPVPWGPGSFGAVVVTNYLHRPLFADLVAALAPGGVLLYETFSSGHELIGRPRRPEFILRPGELLEVTVGLELIEYRLGHEPDRDAITQSVAARRPVT